MSERVGAPAVSRGKGLVANRDLVWTNIQAPSAETLACTLVTDGINNQFQA